MAYRCGKFNVLLLAYLARKKQKVRLHIFDDVGVQQLNAFFTGLVRDLNPVACPEGEILTTTLWRIPNKHRQT